METKFQHYCAGKGRPMSATCPQARHATAVEGTYMNEVFPQNRSSRRVLRKLRKARTTRITFVPS